MSKARTAAFHAIRFACRYAHYYYDCLRNGHHYCVAHSAGGHVSSSAQAQRSARPTSLKGSFSNPDLLAGCKSLPGDSARPQEKPQRAMPQHLCSKVRHRVPRLGHKGPVTQSRQGQAAPSKVCEAQHVCTGPLCHAQMGWSRASTAQCKATARLQDGRPTAPIDGPPPPLLTV